MAKNFTPGSNTFNQAGVGVPLSVIFDEQAKLIADGAITILSGLVRIAKTSAAAITLAVPDQDGQQLIIVSETAFAHTITTVSPGYNNTSAYTVITLSPIIGDSVVLQSTDGAWWVVKPSWNTQNPNTQLIPGDGAITIKNGTVILSKGSAAAITIAAPVAVTDDGATLTIITSTAQAHVITSAVDGFNAKGSSGTATYTAAIGNSCTLVANNGHWYVPVKTGVAIA